MRRLLTAAIILALFFLGFPVLAQADEAAEDAEQTQVEQYVDLNEYVFDGYDILRLEDNDEVTQALIMEDDR